MSMLTFSMDRRFQDTGTQGSSVRGSRRSRGEWKPELPGVSYPPPVPRTTFQGHSVERNLKVDDVHANIFQGQKVSGHRNTRFKCSGIQTIQTRMETNFFCLGIQRQRVAAKGQPGEARFGLELDWEKLWRRQVFGARMGAREERKV